MLASQEADLPKDLAKMFAPGNFNGEKIEWKNISIKYFGWIREEFYRQEKRVHS
jgi:hypothetical protein